MANIISSDSFIELFITLKQIRHLGNNKDINLFSAVWCFNVTDLKEFILHSKKDYRYQELLSSFNFEFIDNIPYSMDLIFSLNRAMSKHLITGIYDDIVYISRYYANGHILEENREFYSLMNEFLGDFEDFCLDKNSYLNNSECFIDIDSERKTDNSRLIFDLQRRIVKTYEDKE